MCVVPLEHITDMCLNNTIAEDFQTRRPNKKQLVLCLSKFLIHTRLNSVSFGMRGKHIVRVLQVALFYFTQNISFSEKKNVMVYHLLQTCSVRFVVSRLLSLTCS